MSGMRPYLSFMGRLGSQCLRQISPSAQLMALLEEEGCHSALSSSGRVLRRATGLRSILDRSHPDVARLQGRYGHHHDGLMQRAQLHSSSSNHAAQPARADRTPEASTSAPAPLRGTSEAMQKLIRQKTLGGRVQLPPTMAQGMTQISAPLSPNILAEPYKGELPPLPFSAWFTLQGYRDRWQRFIGGAKSMYTLAKCRKYVPGFGLPAFKADVLRVYEDACAGIARGHRTLLRQILTPAEYSNVKAQLKAREDGGWKRVEWSLARRPHLHELEVVHGRMIAPNPKDEKSAYAQLTVRIRALHRFAAYSGSGALKAGSPGKEFPVQDVWIFERAFKQGPTSRWRVAGRLSLPPVPPQQGSWLNPMTWLRVIGPKSTPSASKKPALKGSVIEG